MAADYAAFIARKNVRAQQTGQPCNPSDVHPMLHGWQKDVVAWAVHTGRAAIWAGTGMGKTVMQLEWARLSGKTALIVAPLAVCRQTVREAAKIGMGVEYVRDGGTLPPGVWITSFELADRFDPASLDAVVLDEASILKNSDGKTSTKFIKHFGDVPARLACTATPAPNDPEELTTQAEFLGRSTRRDMLAAYFVHDSDGWRLKGHARGPMFRWMASWAIALRSPADIGYPDDDYRLPGLRIIDHLVDAEIEAEGQLFPTDLGGVGGRAQIRKQTVRQRCEKAAAIIAAEPGEPWLVWCGRNDEADLMAKLVPGAVNVHGSMTPEQKADALLGFADGDIRCMVTKPKIASFGMNWQHCARMVFVGMNDSYEAYYQAIRRCYRYGQPRVVDVHIVLSEIESQIAANVARKERESFAIIEELVNEMRKGSTWNSKP